MLWESVYVSWNESVAVIGFQLYFSFFLNCSNSLIHGICVGWVLSYSLHPNGTFIQFYSLINEEKIKQFFSFDFSLQKLNPYSKSLKGAMDAVKPPHCKSSKRTSRWPCWNSFISSGSTRGWISDQLNATGLLSRH